MKRFLVRRDAGRELAIGAIASGGIRILNQDVIKAMGVSQKESACGIKILHM